MLHYEQYLMAASITRIVILVTTQTIWQTTRMLPRDTGSIGTSRLLRYLPKQSEAGLPPSAQQPLARRPNPTGRTVLFGFDIVTKVEYDLTCLE
ncbi:hypothetical protein D3C77_698360 [compost metagenome]